MSCRRRQDTEDLTIFWGRNRDEGSLREACDTGTYTMVIISFLSVFGHVLLSVGGDGDRYSLPTARAARDLVDHLCHAYLGGGRRGVPRPFGDAVLDGVDLYVDHGGSANYDVLARRLAWYRYGYGGEKANAVLLTATPRCMGDGGVDAALATGLFGASTSADKRFFYGSWLGWTERFQEAKVYVRLPAAPDAASDGWVEPKAVAMEMMPLVQETPNYGGVMLWNRYYDKRNRYGLRIKLIMVGSPCTDGSTLSRSRSVAGSIHPLIPSVAGSPTRSLATGNLDTHMCHAPQNGRVSWWSYPHRASSPSSPPPMSALTSTREHGVAERAAADAAPAGAAAEEGVPEVVGDVPGGGRGVVAASDDGEEH
uniref:GH18 domain-containing protein n=1 Tax=Setaria italica TaxID=4555 RepID=K3ZL85_SETIT